MSHQDWKPKTKTESKSNPRGDSLPQGSPWKPSGSSGGAVPLLNSVDLGRALQWILARVDWSAVGFRDDCSWTPRVLAAAAILWAWSDEWTLGERFVAARRLVAHLPSEEPSEGPLATSYQAFIKLLMRWTATLVILLQTAFRQRMQESLSSSWTVAGFVVFGVDGSRAELPRTKSHEAAYSPSPQRSGKTKRDRRKQPKQAAHTRKANVPQIWMTVLLHLGTGLPWDWRRGPSDSSERAHALEMRGSLPAKSLLTADAGFIGYDFADTFLKAGHHVLLRVGANVRLLKKLGYVEESEGLVYLWPEKSAKKNLPPLVFRLIVAQGPRHPIYILTSVLDSTELSDAQVFEVYKCRWGIELFYRHLKQTFQRRKLRSSSAANAALELEWSLVGLWAMGLFACVEIARAKIPLKRLSIAGVLRVFRRLMRDDLHPADPSRPLYQQLREALVDEYVRQNKQSRDYPRKKQHTRTSPPNIVNATAQQVRQAKALKNALAVKKG